MRDLQSLLADHRWLVSRVKIAAPEPTSLRSVVASIKANGESAEKTEETPALQERVALAVDSGSVGQLSKRDLRAICNVYLHSPQPPGRNRAIGDKIIAEIKRRGLRSPAVALFNAYLDGFKLD